MDWADQVEKSSGEYFKIQEGDNRIQLLSHLAPYALKWTGSRYEPADEGDQNVSHKGVGWVLQDGLIKSATLPYTVVRAIKELMNDPDYAFEEFPMPRLINIRAKGAGTKEVEYTVVPAPKEVEVSAEILAHLKEKMSPEDFVEKMRTSEKSKVSPEKNLDPGGISGGIDGADIPF